MNKTCTCLILYMVLPQASARRSGSSGKSTIITVFEPSNSANAIDAPQAERAEFPASDVEVDMTSQ